MSAQQPSRPSVVAPEIGELVDTLSLDHTDNTVLIAEILADLGMRVMPVQGGRKHAIPGSKGLAGATNDSADVSGLWGAASTSTMTPGIAVEPGSAGLAVLTCDNRYAEEAWTLLTGVDLASAATIVSETPSGGKHFWFSLPQGADPVSTHLPGIGLKARSGYVIVVAGSGKGRSQAVYAHTQNEDHDTWAPLIAPHRVIPPAGDYRGECTDGYAEERLADLNALFVSPAQPELVKEIIDGVLNETWTDAGGLRAQCRMAFELVCQLADAAIESRVHLGDALDKARNRWLGHCSDFGSAKAMDLVWLYIRNLVIASNSYAPAPIEAVATPTASISDLDWTEPFNQQGHVKAILLNLIAPDKVSVAAALGPVWEVNPQSIVAAIDAVAAQVGESELITQDSVFEYLFDTPDAWAPNQRANTAALHAVIQKLARFKVGPDGDLWRYNYSGDRAGLWTQDGEQFLRRLMLRLLRSRYTRIAYETVAEIVAAHCDGLQMPDDDSTWQDPHLIFCRNGVVDWAGDARPRLARPEDNLTVQHSWDWDPDAECPVFDEFVAQTFQEDAHETVHEVCGAVLYPLAPWKRAILLYGPKDSGKSTFLKALTALVGKQNVSTLSLQQIGRNDFMTSELFGRRVNICGDISSEEMPDPAKFKILVGGDEPIQGDRKHKRPFTFYNRAKLVFSANELPRTTDKTSAYFERWIPLKCARVVSSGAIDITLPQRLTSPNELAGIGVKAIRGLGRLMENHGFTLPASSEQVLQEYRMQEDFVLQWFEERVDFTRNEEDWIEKEAIIEDHQKWCESVGIRNPASYQRLAKTAGRLEHRHPGFHWSKVKRVGSRGQSLRVSVGAKLRPPDAKLTGDDI